LTGDGGAAYDQLDDDADGSDHDHHVEDHHDHDAVWIARPVAPGAAGLATRL